MAVKKIRQKIFEGIWEDGILPRTRSGRLSLKLTRIFIAVMRDMREGHYAQRAASLAYTTLVTFIPLLAIAFSALKGFGAHDALEAPLRSYLAPLGQGADEAAAHIIGFVEKVNVGVLGAVGTGLLLFGVISMLYKMEYAFNDIWRVERPRTWLRRLRDYLSVIFVAPLSMFLAVAMTTTLQHADYAWKWLKLDLVDGAMEQVFSIVPWILFVLAFGALFAFMPNTRVKPLPALVAGLVTAVLWKVLGKLFGMFVAGSASYAAIYSVFAVLVLFMIWVFSGWVVVLVGASVCYYLQHPSNQPLARNMRNLSLRMKEKIALQSCAEIGRAFYGGRMGLSLHELSVLLRMPSQAVFDVVEDLAAAGVLAATETGTMHYIPGRPFDDATVEDLLLAIRSADEHGVLQVIKIHVSSAVAAVVKIGDRAVHDKFHKYTLKQLALGSIEA